MYIVAGVSGHVGSVVAEQLLAKGEKVKVIVRDPAKGMAWSKRGAEVAVGSLEDAAFLTTAFKGATAAFLLVPPDFAAADVFAAQRKVGDAFASAVKSSGLSHVVLLSSIGADLEAGTGPIKGLNYAEKALRGAGTTLTAIRAGYFQENAGHVIGVAKEKGIFPTYMPAAAPTPMIATRDIGQLAAESLLAKPSKSENVDLHGPTYTGHQVAEKLGAALGKKLQVVEIPREGWLGAMAQSGMPKPWAESYVEMYGGFMSGAVKPSGDRMAHGKTELDATLKTLIG